MAVSATPISSPISSRACVATVSAMIRSARCYPTIRAASSASTSSANEEAVMAKKKILLVGESWVSSASHTKGWDTFSSVTFHLGAEPLVNALKGSAFELVYMKAHEAATDFPLTIEGLSAYDGLILSDIGANTLLLHPDVWLHG